MKPSEELLIRLLKEKHRAVSANLDTFLRVLAGEDLQAKKLHAEYSLTAAKDLRGVLAQQDVPDWLNILLSVIPGFISGSITSADLLINLIPQKEPIERHRWLFDGSVEQAFDFDAIYEHFKRESRLPELFDQVIKILQEIHDSGEIDSVMMMQALGKVISTIKKSKDGSYFSLISAWDFLISFLRNYIWEEISNLPVFGSAIVALRTTVGELNDEMFTLRQNMQDEMSKTVGAEIKKLDGKTNFSSVAYDKSGYLLPASTTPLLEGKA